MSRLDPNINTIEPGQIWVFTGSALEREIRYVEGGDIVYRTVGENRLYTSSVYWLLQYHTLKPEPLIAEPVTLHVYRHSNGEVAVSAIPNPSADIGSITINPDHTWSET